MTTIYTVKVDDYGTKSWFLNGKRHRVDGPAVECANGNKCWYHDGKCHRVDGPAIEGADGTKEWLLDGKQLTQAQWKRAVKPKVVKPKVASCVGKIVEVDGVKYKLVAA